ncbi:MAG: hypothetical protein GX195_00480 [Firmicutes bacterium]|jgi:hypothetical protein|nr:hypothetical protein [Bacillota bacterium]
MAPAGGKSLTALYETKLRLFRSLEMLSRQCTAVSFNFDEVADTGITRLQALLDERAKLMAEIDALDVEIAGAEAVQDRHAVQHIRTELAAIGERIRQMDARLQKTLERETGMLRDAARREQAGQRSTRAYKHKPEAGEGFFIDKRT